MTLFNTIFASASSKNAEKVFLTKNPSAFGVSASLAGVPVSERTSFQVSQYYACLSNISEDLGKIPFGVFRILKEGGKQFLPDDPVTKLLNQSPNDDMTAMTFKQVVSMWAIGWGNGYAEIVRNGAGTPVALIPIHPTRVIIVRDSDGDIKYQIFGSFEECVMTQASSPNVVLDSEDILHIIGRHSPDGLCGISVATDAKTSLGTVLATQDFGATFFGNNTVVGGILTHPETLSDTAKQNLTKSIENRFRGTSNSFKSMILEEGLKWENVSVPPTDAQFIESREFQVADIARWFRMPLSKLQSGDAKAKSVEQENINYTQDTLMPWAVRWEEEVDRKLLNNSTRKKSKYKLRELLRGDTKAQSEFSRTMVTNGIMTLNEVRETMDLNPLESDKGDENFMQLAMTTVDNIVNTEVDDAKAQGAANDPEPADMEQDNQPNQPTDPTGEEEGTETEEEQASSFYPIIESVCNLLDDKNTKALVRAREKVAKKVKGFNLYEWAADFYVKQKADAVSRVLPIAETFMNAVGVKDKARVRKIFMSAIICHYDDKEDDPLVMNSCSLADSIYSVFINVEKSKGKIDG